MNRDQSIDYAKKYVEDLLSFFGLNTDVSVRCEEDVIELSVPSTHLNGFLIGQRGETLRSLQYLLSMALKNSQAEISRVSIDVASYKRHRADRLAEQAKKWCQEVIDSKEDMPLKPMNPSDRRVVHGVVSEYGQLESHSEGEGKSRHLIITFKKDI